MMNFRARNKIFAVGIVVLLVISGSIGYMIVSHQGSATDADEKEQTGYEETIKTTDETLPSVQAHIEAGPLIGYGPLLVQFYGNPENDSTIVSYHWEFGPTTKPIIPQSQYKNVRFSLILLVMLRLAYIIIYTLLSHYRYKTTSQYESTECNPTMIFPYTGSYSATLTVTDTQGNASSDTVWVTVLQYEYPDND